MNYFVMGWIHIFVSVIFNFAETWYFGWNLAPQSPAEMVCDYISILLFFMGLLFLSMAALKELRKAVG